MTILRVLTYPDPFLKKKTEPVTNFDENLKKLVENMADTMYAERGVGLAANQVGESLSLLIYDPAADAEKRNFTVVANPKLLFSEGDFLSENEGCLSVPEFRANVKRFEKILVEAQDVEGNLFRLDLSEMEAVILQHEMDHLSGKLFIDHISSLKRAMYTKRVAKQIKKEDY